MHFFPLFVVTLSIATSRQDDSSELRLSGGTTSSSSRSSSDGEGGRGASEEWGAAGTEGLEMFPGGNPTFVPALLGETMSFDFTSLN